MSFDINGSIDTAHGAPLILPYLRTSCVTSMIPYKLKVCFELHSVPSYTMLIS